MCRQSKVYRAGLPSSFALQISPHSTLTIPRDTLTTLLGPALTWHLNTTLPCLQHTTWLHTTSTKLSSWTTRRKILAKKTIKKMTVETRVMPTIEEERDWNLRWELLTLMQIRSPSACKAPQTTSKHPNLDEQILDCLYAFAQCNESTCDFYNDVPSLSRILPLPLLLCLSSLYRLIEYLWL